MPRRNTELGLILLASAGSVALYVLANIAATEEIPKNIVPILAAVVGLLCVANLATRRLAPSADGTLLPMAALLNGLGYVMISRLEPDLAAQQALWTGVGISAFVFTLLVVRSSRDLERYRYTVAVIGLALLLVPLVPGLGVEINGARIWVRAGPVSFQPGEFAKLALAVFFAAYLVERREILGAGARKFGPVAVPDPKHLGPILLAWAASLVVMVAERDLGSSLLFFALFLVLLWVGTEQASYLVAGVALFAAGAVAAWQMFAHVRLRVEMWLDPWQDVGDGGYQIVQAAFAMSDSGLGGTGIARGGQVRIPYSESDFIFAVIAEELGLVGATLVLAAFVCMVGAGLRIAIEAERPFDKLLATGLTTLLGVQAFVIIGGVIRLLPLTGVTLPFVSYGGSSLVANYVLLAILLRISDQNARRRAAAALKVDAGVPVS
jgi:cell division protein FtsW (lipid II flippase)